jgi:hypothetical protein
MRVIANTPHGSWEGGRHFGLRELLEQSRARPDRIQVAIKEINRSLDGLGITNFQVESIECESAPGDEASRWVVTLVSTVDRTKTYSLVWSGRTE